MSEVKGGVYNLGDVLEMTREEECSGGKGVSIIIGIVIYWRKNVPGRRMGRERSDNHTDTSKATLNTEGKLTGDFLGNEMNEI